MFTIVCKATFHLKPGQPATLVSPDALAATDFSWHRETQSIGVPTDLVPLKRNVDVLLIGHAYAPGRRPVTSLIVGLSVGHLTKSILVTGDRVWNPDGTCPEPAPFLRMPLCWERAAGGPSTWNPLGVPVGARIDPSTQPPIPNLLPRGFVIQNSNHLIPPVGFGAIAPHWPARATFVRKWATTWNHTKWNEGLLPPDLDAGYFNAAPMDQQLRELPETTAITLDHLHPDMPRLTTVVEDLRPRARITTAPGTAPRDILLRPDTLLIDVDRVTCSLTWRATIALRHPQEEGVVHVEPTRGVATPAPVHQHAVLPFQPSASKPPPASTTNPSTMTTSAPPGGALAADKRRWDTPEMDTPVDEFTTLPLRHEPRSSDAPLPFRPPASSNPPSAPAFTPPVARNDKPAAALALPSRPSAPSKVNFGADDDDEVTPVPFRPPSPSQANFRTDDDDDVTPVPFRPPSPSQANFRAEDEVTAVHAKLIATPTRAAPNEPAASLIPAMTVRTVRPGKTLIPDTPASSEPALPFRPVPRGPEDPAAARNRFAAMSSSSALPFQTSALRGDVPPPRERLASVPAASVAGTPFVLPSAPTPSPTPVPAPAAPLVASGLPFQTPPPNDVPPQPRERMPSVPPSTLLFGAPLGTNLPQPATSQPISLGSSGLPFQSTPPNEAPPPPRERMPSVLLSATPFSAPPATAPAIASVPTPPLSAASDMLRPMAWLGSSGNSDILQTTLQAAKSDDSPPPKPKSELSFEKYARIKVHLWSADASREDVLSKHGLDEIEWRILEQQQTEALEHEAKEGKCDLALALVAAFEAANAPSLTAP